VKIKKHIGFSVLLGIMPFQATSVLGVDGNGPNDFKSKKCQEDISEEETREIVHLFMEEDCSRNTELRHDKLDCLSEVRKKNRILFEIIKQWSCLNNLEENFPYFDCEEFIFMIRFKLQNHKAELTRKNDMPSDPNDLNLGKRSPGKLKESFDLLCERQSNEELLGAYCQIKYYGILKNSKVDDKLLKKFIELLREDPSKTSDHQPLSPAGFVGNYSEKTSNKIRTFKKNLSAPINPISDFNLEDSKGSVSNLRTKLLEGGIIDGGKYDSFKGQSNPNLDLNLNEEKFEKEDPREESKEESKKKRCRKMIEKNNQ
jgi:hypothetical protein